MSSAKDFFQVEMTGGTIVITPIGDINSLSAELLHEAAEMMTELIESNESPMLVIDLSNVPSWPRHHLVTTSSYKGMREGTLNHNGVYA